MLLDAFFGAGAADDESDESFEDIVLPELTRGVKIFRGVPVEN
jgi:hypothetical protein